MILVTLVRFAITDIPFLQDLFATEPVSQRNDLLIVGVGVVLFAVIEIEKQLRLRLRMATA